PPALPPFPTRRSSDLRAPIAPVAAILEYRHPSGTLIGTPRRSTHMPNNCTVHMIGQAHLDPVWLWRWTEGRAEALATSQSAVDRDRKSTRLNSSHVKI